MKTPRMAEAMNYIDDDLVSGAITYTRKKNTGWVKWCALAACLCLIISIAIPVLHYKGGLDHQGHVEDIAALEYNGKFYEAVDIPEVLKKYGLPAKITADMAGEHLAYLQQRGDSGYKCTTTVTDMELYQYAPAPCDGVLVLRDGNAWFAALFCNFYGFDDNTNYEFTELYRVYGIERADDIASITEMGKGNKKEIGKPVTDALEIETFYSITTALLSYGNDDYQEMLYGGIPEEDQQAFHSAVAGDRRNLRIETTDGICFFIAFYPNYNWIYGTGALSYYQINEAMHDWINRNLND